MPRAPYRVPNNQAFGKRRVVVSTGSVDSEELIADPCDQYRFITDMTCQQASFAQ